MGYDKHGYGYRSCSGEKISEGRREPYGASYKEGDVVGMYAYLGHRPTQRVRCRRSSPHSGRS